MERVFDNHLLTLLQADAVKNGLVFEQRNTNIFIPTRGDILRHHFQKYDINDKTFEVLDNIKYVIQNLYDYQILRICLKVRHYSSGEIKYLFLKGITKKESIWDICEIGNAFYTDFKYQYFH